MVEVFAKKLKLLKNWLDTKQSRKNAFGILFQLYRNIWMDVPPDEIHIRFILQELTEENDLSEQEIKDLMNVIMPLYNSLAEINDSIIPIIDTEEYEEDFTGDLQKYFRPIIEEYESDFEEMKSIFLQEAEYILEEADQFLELPFDWRDFNITEEEEKDFTFNPLDYGYEEGFVLILASVRNEYLEEYKSYSIYDLWAFFISIYTAAQMMDKLRRERLLESNGF